MISMTLLVLLVVLTVSVFIVSVTSHEWTKTFHEDSTVKGRTCSNENKLFDIKQPSQASCAARCLWTEGCSSIYFDKLSKTCVGCNATCDESTSPSLFTDMRCWNEDAGGVHDCLDVLRRDPDATDGVYDVITWAGSMVSVYCVMSKLDGGWTVFIRRFDGSVPFNRPLVEYETLFGDPKAEHWLGLKTIHEMTASTLNDVYLTSCAVGFGKEMVGTQNLSDFYIGPGPGYRLHVGKLILQTLSDVSSADLTGRGILSEANGVKFSSLDIDNDNEPFIDCSERHGYGGWWYDNCGYLIPTGIFMTPGTFNDKSMHDKGILGNQSLKNLTYMFRRRV